MNFSIPYNKTAILAAEEKLPPLRGHTINHQDGKSIEVFGDDDIGVFHTATKVNTKLDFQCGKIIFR